MAVVANATLIALSAALGWRLVRQYQAQPRLHTLWYAIGLILTALAAVPEFYHETAGNIPTALWWLYWVLGSSLVGALAVGTSYLVSAKAGKVAMALFLILVVWLGLATVFSAGTGPADLAAPFSKAPTAAIKVPFLIQSILGALMIFGGALWSFVRTKYWSNLWIAVGTLIFSMGGASSGLLKYASIFSFTQTVGIILLYIGVSSSLGGRRPSPSVEA